MKEFKSRLIHHAMLEAPPLALRYLEVSCQLLRPVCIIYDVARRVK